MHRQKGSGLVPWPQRLFSAPPRSEEVGVSAEEFKEDSVSFLIGVNVIYGFEALAATNAVYYYLFILTYPRSLRERFNLCRRFGNLEWQNIGTK